MKPFLDSHENEHFPSKDTEIKCRVSVYALIKKGDSVLCIKEEGSDKWELPGGGVDAPETFVEALERECWEETGYRVQMTSEQPLFAKQKRFYRTSTKDFWQGAEFIFATELISEDQDLSVVEKNIGETITHIEWIPLNEITAKNTHHDFWLYLQTLK